MIFRVLCLVLALLLSACAVRQLPQNLSRAVMQQDNPELVKSGLPSYLLMLDALVLTYPEDDSFLFSAAKLNAAYAGSFADNPEQAKRMAKKALDYAQRGLCEEESKLCQIRTLSAEKITQTLSAYDDDDVPTMYAFASAWLSYIQAHSDDWAAIADLAKAKAMMLWVVHTQPQYEKGMPYVYLGVIEAQVPANLGGKPELAKAYFAQAFTYSGKKNLMSRLYYAKFYARLVFNQKLHDTVLKQILSTPLQSDDFTLMNVLAKQQAQVLLNSSSDYFE